jgi:hypothetical protein
MSGSSWNFDGDPCAVCDESYGRGDRRLLDRGGVRLVAAAVGRDADGVAVALGAASTKPGGLRAMVGSAVEGVRWGWRRLGVAGVGTAVGAP